MELTSIHRCPVCSYCENSWCVAVQPPEFDCFTNADMLSLMHCSGGDIFDLLPIFPASANALLLLGSLRWVGIWIPLEPNYLRMCSWQQNCTNGKAKTLKCKARQHGQSLFLWQRKQLACTPSAQRVTRRQGKSNAIHCLDDSNGRRYPKAGEIQQTAMVFERGCFRATERITPVISPSISNSLDTREYFLDTYHNIMHINTWWSI